MLFDAKTLTRDEVQQAIDKFIEERPKFHKPRSAFVLYDSEKLPAKFIVRMALQVKTGAMPNPEQITGGKASVKVLKDLGFNAVYEKLPKRKNRNVIKSARRYAFQQVVEKYWGKTVQESKIDGLSVPDLVNRTNMPVQLSKVLASIEKQRNYTIKGKKGYKLKCDYIIPDIKLVIEFDERQHFSALRAASFRAYPQNVPLGFDKEKWIQLSDHIQAGDNDPYYRDEQRAFYDSMRDIIIPQLGYKPVIRVYENDVHWEKGYKNDPVASEILKTIGRIVEMY